MTARHTRLPYSSTQPSPSPSANKVAQPRLSTVRWRISVCISSATCSRVLRPFVLLELTLSNGSIRTMEMSVDKFNELRFSVAQVPRPLHSFLVPCRVSHARCRHSRQCMRWVPTHFSS